MKTLRKMGLVPLTKNETVENNGGGILEDAMQKLKDFGKVCCYNIPPMDHSTIWYNGK